jgi:hypothetical protein
MNDLNAIASTLNLMNYAVLDLQTPLATPSSFSCDALPLVVIPRQSAGAAGGAMEQGEGTIRLLSPSPFGDNPTHITSLGNSDALEVGRFLVYYHPSQDQDFRKLKGLVANCLDVASAQVYIETMVLEVREEDSDQLGLEYSKADGDKFITFGGLMPGSNSIDFLRDTLRDPFSLERIY